MVSVLLLHIFLLRVPPLHVIDQIETEKSGISNKLEFRFVLFSREELNDKQNSSGDKEQVNDCPANFKQQKHEPDKKQDNDQRPYQAEHICASFRVAVLLNSMDRLRVIHHMKRETRLISEMPISEIALPMTV
jgi:hypothetical protein